MNPQKTTSFAYDEESGKYLVSEYGIQYKDGNLDEQLAVKNVIVMYVAYSNVPGDTYGRLRANMSSGNGVYFHDTVAEEFTWECSSSGLFFKTPEGGDLLLCPGNSYVCCASSYTGGVDW